MQPETGQWVRPSDAIRIELGRPLDPSEGRLAIVLGTTDWTGVARSTSSSIEITPGPIRLPRGRHDVVLYVVSPRNVWREVAKFALSVLTESGFEQADAKPSVEIGVAGQPARGQQPEVPPGPRDTFHDTTVRAGLQTTHVRNGWTTTSQVNVVGVSYRNEALRFAQEGEAAPLVDLADYRVGLENSHVTLGLGHAAWGSHRQLASGFASRGATSLVKLGRVVDLSLAALNGSSIVGIDNPFGLADSSHRVVGATVGVEAVPARPGALRLSASILDGSVLALAGFNQAAVQDAERSRGVGLQIVATDPAGRLQLDSGFARSRFTNPTDPTLDLGFETVDVRETTRNARYFDASYAFVRGGSLGKATQANLTAAFHHSRVEPLYRSVALPITSDLDQNGADVSASIGPATSQVSYQRSRDNLDDIQSILTTRTRAFSWTSSVPLSGFAGANPRAAAFPTLSYVLNRTDQAGDGLPENGLFDSLSQVPDQVSLTHAIGVAWQAATWRAGYSLNRSLQDNRQVGRELADLVNLVHGVQVGVTPSDRFDANLDVAFEGADNREFLLTDLTRRISVSATARPATRTSLGGTVTFAFMRNDPSSSERRTTDFNVQLSQSVAFWPRRPDALQGQAFVRFARQTIWTLALLDATPSDEQFWTLNTGVTFKVF
ncbi:MAG TPA: hypothetical protein VI485_03355 [Vicinamibacterales bacterium]|nr:hypothetical protein [Vicinamibacterales bacterium]